MKAAFLALALCAPLWGACELPATAPQTLAARRVFDDIVQAAGQGDRPALAVVSGGCISLTGPERGAWYDEKNHRVTLDAALVDLCGNESRAQSNCLAFLLGHELAHVYREHYRSSALVSPAADAGNAALERDADLFGGLYGYRAGYDSLSQAPQLLEAVYRFYKLPPKLKGYADLEERKKVAEASLQDLRRLIPVFETGNLMLALGQYAAAAAVFEDLSRKFPSREMFNNYGVSLALRIASLRDPKDLPAYPWVLDAGSRLELASESSRGGADIDERWLFATAKQAFERAKSLDEDYVPAYLNLACLYDLHQAGERHAPLELEDAAARLVKFPGLESALQAATRALKDRVPARAQLGQELDAPEEEQIGDQTASAALAGRPRGEAIKAGPVSIGPVKEYDAYSIFPVQDRNRRWAFVATGDKYSGKTGQGIHAGSTRADLERAYCAAGPACGIEVRTALGHFVRYSKAKIIFVLSDGKVVKWVLYASN